LAYGSIDDGGKFTIPELGLLGGVEKNSLGAIHHLREGVPLKCHFSSTLFDSDRFFPKQTTDAVVIIAATTVARLSFLHHHSYL